MVARYHINLSAFLPTGPLSGDGQRQHELHEGPGEIEYDGTPSTSWIPINDEAKAKMTERLAAAVTRQEQAMQFIDPKSRAMAHHIVKLSNLKRKLAEFSSSEARAAPAAVPEAPKTEKPSRPSDSPNRR